ncbi:ATP-binding protein [Actinoplanes sp. NPDC051343]|uniref:ATP-binding protein n=1 Tax=Actinoplanes sp. NPDC051343 TaxID=3363906 RepID=UPI0037982A90
MQVLRLPFDHGTDSATVRQVARGHLIHWQTAELVDDTLLVITELVQNVIRHTGDGGEVALSHRGDVVLVEVFDHSPDLPELLAPDLRRLGGRGMLLIDAVSHGWGSRSTPTGKVVWARLPIKPTDAPRAPWAI